MFLGEEDSLIINYFYLKCVSHRKGVSQNQIYFVYPEK